MHSGPSTDEYLINVGHIIKRYRTERGFTQARLAEAIGVEPNTVQRYEYGELHLPLCKAARIAEILNFSLDELTLPGRKWK
jgi:transcriptional regulator with XRE-family HTH domain